VPNSTNAFESFCLRVRIPSFLATFPECTFKGQDNNAGDMFFHRPKSTHAHP